MGNFAFLSYYLGAGARRKPHKVVLLEIAIWLVHRYASMQAALLPRGIQTKSNSIQAKNIPVWFCVCGYRASVLF